MGKEVPFDTRKEADTMLQEGNSQHSVVTKLGVSPPWVSGRYKALKAEGLIPPHPGLLSERVLSKTVQENAS